MEVTISGTYVVPLTINKINGPITVGHIQSSEVEIKITPILKISYLWKNGQSNG